MEKGKSSDTTVNDCNGHQSLFPFCSQFHQLFSSYKRYCWEEENCLEFTRRQMESNPFFITFVQVTQSQQEFAAARPAFIIRMKYVSRELE